MLEVWLDFALKLTAVVLPMIITWYVSKNQKNAAIVKRVNEYAHIARAAVQAAEDAGASFKGEAKLNTAIDTFIHATSGNVKEDVAEMYVRGAFREIADTGGFKKK